MFRHSSSCLVLWVHWTKFKTRKHKGEAYVVHPHVSSLFILFSFRSFLRSVSPIPVFGQHFLCTRTTSLHQVSIPNCMQHSPSSESNSRPTTQEIPGLWWIPKVHYRPWHNQPPVPILSQTNAVHTFPPDFPNIHFNIILPSMPRVLRVVSSLQALQQNILYAFVISPCALHASSISSYLTSSC
jgi:hypothetical protein